jgi:hypothetical protein
MNELANKYIQDAIQGVPQNTIAWDKIRLGLFTGSGVADLMVKPKTIADQQAGKLSATAEKYVISKVMEMVTGQGQSNAYGNAIDWGNEWEEQALKEVAKALSCKLEDCEFKPNFKRFNAYSGASPDGIFYAPVLGLKVGIEVKCPYNSIYHYNHCKVLNGNDLKSISPDYYWQVQMNMLTFNLPCWIFASYDVRQPIHRQLHWAVIEANIEDMEDLCKAMEKAQELKEYIYRQWMGI